MVVSILNVDRGLHDVATQYAGSGSRVTRNLDPKERAGSLCHRASDCHVFLSKPRLSPGKGPMQVFRPPAQRLAVADLQGAEVVAARSEP